MISREQRAFNHIATLALQSGILEQWEVDQLSKRGTRKSPYWSRHLLDIKAYVRDKIDDSDRDDLGYILELC